MVSRLWALGGHVTERMRGVLHLGIQKTLGVVQSHYLVNLAALAICYIVAEDLDDDGAHAVVDRLDALAAPAAAALADDFEEVLFLNAPPPDPLSPESGRVLWPLGCSQISSCVAYVIRQFALRTCKLSAIHFILL
jgi:hypothetical protein